MFYRWFTNFSNSLIFKYFQIKTCDKKKMNDLVLLKELKKNRVSNVSRNFVLIFSGFTDESKYKCSDYIKDIYMNIHNSIQFYVTYNSYINNVILSVGKFESKFHFNNQYINIYIFNWKNIILRKINIANYAFIKCS